MNKIFASPEAPENACAVENIDEVLSMFIEAVLGDAYDGQQIDDLPDEVREEVALLISQIRP
ncbi:hypothetical protein [Roseibium alexandrii]|uniref:hypothetical protein n=1 Tax=Roseibium alexandrii TaxID=388408 RepID=UPI0037511A57